MRAEELRIGNYVMLGVNMSMKPFIHKITIDTIREFEHSEPISITEEWLLKLGFEQTFFIDTNEPASWIKDRERWFTKELNLLWWNTNIKHVHQLQNLYFALKGEEL